VAGVVALLNRDIVIGEHLPELGGQTKPGHRLGPSTRDAICRALFGVLGAKISAIIRCLIERRTWYRQSRRKRPGVAAMEVGDCFKALPGPGGRIRRRPVTAYSPPSMLGWWVASLCCPCGFNLQGLSVFHGARPEAIRKLIDFWRPDVYVVMFLLMRLPDLQGGVGVPIGTSTGGGDVSTGFDSITRPRLGANRPFVGGVLLRRRR